MLFAAKPTLVVAGVAALVLAVGGVYHVTKVKALDMLLEQRMDRIEKQMLTINALEGQVSTLRTSLQTALDANRGLEEAIKVQNASIDRMRAEAASRAARAAEALAKAREENRKLEARYLAVLGLTPQYPEDLCRSLDARLRQYVELRQTEGAPQ